MTRSHRSSTALLPVAALAVGLLAACGSDSPTAVDTAAAVPDLEVTSVDAAGSTSVEAAALMAALDAVEVTDLTVAEAEGLAFMREEEKLAHDVYAALYATWQMPIFTNIAASEATHTESVRLLLERHGLEDPAPAAAGSFTDADLQALHDALVAQGTEALEGALRVGAAIEEIDILDLETRMAASTSADIQLVYGNLLKGSRNHLRAFTSQLAGLTGSPYVPEYLTPGAYEAIVGTAMERGRN